MSENHMFPDVFKGGVYKETSVMKQVNPFFPNTPFLYPLKTSENRKVSWCFHGVEKGYIGDEWVNKFSRY